jgi:pyruvate/2-oxoglutarate dehydrogenase complex dihydrolipoamide acyltransferase (E2) component
MLSSKRLHAASGQLPSSTPERSEPVDYAERWLCDGLEICQPPAFFHTVEVDMTNCRVILEQINKTCVKATYTHAVVRATALALAAHPDLHQVVCGGRRHFPSRIDIGLSVAGEAFLSPTLVLEGAECKSISELAREIKLRAPQVRQSDREMLRLLRRWGWLVPLGILRRTLLRLLRTRKPFRCKASGTFQVTCLPGVDLFVPAAFATSAIVAAGAVRERVIAHNGESVVRPTLFLTCGADHRVWDGRAAERFLGTMKTILESGKL